MHTVVGSGAAAVGLAELLLAGALYRMHNRSRAALFVVFALAMGFASFTLFYMA